MPNEAAAVRRWFSREMEYFAEVRAATACGCGWPEMTDATAKKPVPPDEQHSVVALASCLEQLPGKHHVAEILLTWVGEEGCTPTNRCDISLTELRAPDFRFRRHEIPRVRAV